MPEEVYVWEATAVLRAAAVAQVPSAFISSVAVAHLQVPNFEASAPFGQTVQSVLAAPLHYPHSALQSLHVLLSTY